MVGLCVWGGYVLSAKGVGSGRLQDNVGDKIEQDNSNLEQDSTTVQVLVSLLGDFLFS